MGSLTFNDLVKELKSLKGNTAITFHSIGDVDAVASAFALQHLVKGAEVRRIDSVNSQARKVWGRLNLNLDAFGEGELEKYDNLIFMDVSTPALLGNLHNEFGKFKGKIIAIDHHLHNHPMKGEIYCDPKKTSCSEIVFGLFGAMGRKVEDGDAILIALGIVSDTADLKSANNSAIEALGECLKGSTMDLQEIYQLLEVREDAAEKIAVMEAVKRAQYERIGELLIASTQVSAFELKCASALIGLGCDFAVVANQKEGKISAVKGRAMELGKFNVGKEIDAAAKRFHGSGGGHEMVGGANFLHGLDAISAADRLMAEVREQIG
ncbi:MAG: DHH family phosphoesterase [Candidatus Micrarchaeota archaeon]